MPFDGVESEVTERLVIGRARIEAGWCQKVDRRLRWTMLGRRPEYCLMGAIRWDRQRGRMGSPNEATDLLVPAIVHLGYGLQGAAEFNDCPGRTKAEVLDVLDLAIAMSRGEYQCHVSTP